jgi:anti-anti-sigma regulatory factor
MEIQTFPVGSFVLFHVNGEMLEEDFTYLRREVNNILTQGLTKIALNFESVPRYSPDGLDELSSLRIDIERYKGALRIFNPNNDLEIALRTLGMDSLVVHRSLLKEINGAIAKKEAQEQRAAEILQLESEDFARKIPSFPQAQLPVKEELKPVIVAPPPPKVMVGKKEPLIVHPPEPKIQITPEEQELKPAVVEQLPNIQKSEPPVPQTIIRPEIFEIDSEPLLKPKIQTRAIDQILLSGMTIPIHEKMYHIVVLDVDQKGLEKFYTLLDRFAQQKMIKGRDTKSLFSGDRSVMFIDYYLENNVKTMQLTISPNIEIDVRTLWGFKKHHIIWDLVAREMNGFILMFPPVLTDSKLRALQDLFKFFQTVNEVTVPYIICVPDALDVDSSDKILTALAIEPTVQIFQFFENNPDRVGEILKLFTSQIHSLEAGT